MPTVLGSVGIETKLPKDVDGNSVWAPGVKDNLTDEIDALHVLGDFLESGEEWLEEQGETLEGHLARSGKSVLEWFKEIKEEIGLDGREFIARAENFIKKFFDIFDVEELEAAEIGAPSVVNPQGIVKTWAEYIEEQAWDDKVFVKKNDFVMMNTPGNGGEGVIELKVSDYLNLLKQQDAANAPTSIDNSLLNVRVEAAPTAAKDHSGAQADADWRNGTAVVLKDAQIIMNPNVLNGDGLNNTALAGIVTDNYRPGAAEIASSHQQAQTNLQDLGNAMNSVLQNPAQNLVRFDMGSVTAVTGGIVGATPTVVTSYEQTITFQEGVLWGHDGVAMTIVTERVDITNTIDVYQGGALVFHEVQQESFRIVNIDPIVIDLDGDGIELKNFDESGVFFDDDGDGLTNFSFKTEPAYSAPSFGLQHSAKILNVSAADTPSVFAKCFASKSCAA